MLMAVVPKPEVENSLLSGRAVRSADQPIGKLMAEALKYPNLVSLAAGFVDNATLPCKVVEECLREICNQTPRMTKALQYGSTAGNRELREAIAEWNYADFGDAKPSADRIILTSGSNQFLQLLSEAILDPGDIVLVAAPTYFVYVGTLKGIGARVIGIPADEHGMDIEALQSKMAELKAQGDAGRVKAIYTVTEFDNPAGSTLSLERRQALMELVGRWRAEQGPLWILSDNAYELLRYAGTRIPPFASIAADAAEYVFELGTFSKSFSPGVRVGWGIVPEPMVDVLLDMKANSDFGSPHLNQMIMHEAIVSGALDRHLPKIRAGYKAKLDAMLEALDKEFGEHPEVHWRVPEGGLYVWVTLPEECDASESGPLWSRAVESGVLYVPGHYCYPDEGMAPKRNTIRLSFGVQDPQGIGQGIQRLARAFDDCCATI